MDQIAVGRIRLRRTGGRVIGGGLAGSAAASRLFALVLAALVGLGSADSRGQSSSDGFPIPDDDASRVFESGQFAGYAMACRLDWKSYYLAFMRAERAERWDGDQLAVIGALFGFVQQRAAGSIGDCTAELHARLKHELRLRMSALGR